MEPLPQSSETNTSIKHPHSIGKGLGSICNAIFFKNITSVKNQVICSTVHLSDNTQLLLVQEIVIN